MSFLIFFHGSLVVDGSIANGFLEFIDCGPKDFLISYQSFKCQLLLASKNSHELLKDRVAFLAVLD